MRPALSPCGSPRPLSVLLPPLLWITLLFLASTAQADRANDALGPARDLDDVGMGSFLVKREDGLHEAPRLETDVSIEVAGWITRAQVTQRFTNPTEDWVEGVYVFPLPENAAVDGLLLRIGERVIAGRIEERARAKAIYEEARESGRKASLVEQERPNVFTTSVANLGPGETLTVALTYQADARYDGGEFSLRFPLVVAPRYVPGTHAVQGFEGTGWATNTDAVPDAARITPPVRPPDEAREHRVHLRAEIAPGFPLARIASPSHGIRVRAAENDVHHVELDASDESDAQADRDFVLRWTPRVGHAPQAALFRERWQNEDYTLLMVLPPSEAAAETPRLSRETILVVDTSGSMGGTSIEQARRALHVALEALEPEDSFNVIAFDSATRSLFPASRPASPRWIARARRWVDGLQANGGTEMDAALKAALRDDGESRAVRQVVFLTDGAVGNESALFARIERDLGRSRLYPVGIGSAPNAHFMTRAAAFGRGTFTYVGTTDEILPRMRELFTKIDRPVLTDLEIDWGEARVEAYPRRIPDVYQGEPVVVAARIPDGLDAVTLRGRRGEERLTIPIRLRGGGGHDGVARLWARRKVADRMDAMHTRNARPEDVEAEVKALGLRHHLVTRWTSLVAVDVTPTRPVDAPLDTRAIEALLPAGWDFAKVFGDDETRPTRGIAPAPPPPLRLASNAAESDATIGGPAAGIGVGQLPQGSTPAPLLLLLGSGLLGGAGLLGRPRRSAPEAAEGDATEVGR